MRQTRINDTGILNQTPARLCDSKADNFGTEYNCTEPVKYQITVTTIVPRLLDPNKIVVRNMCEAHARIYRNKLHYEINNLHKNKSYEQIEVKHGTAS